MSLMVTDAALAKAARLGVALREATKEFEAGYIARTNDLAQRDVVAIMAKQVDDFIDLLVGGAALHDLEAQRDYMTNTWNSGRQFDLSGQVPAIFANYVQHTGVGDDVLLVLSEEYPAINEAYGLWRDLQVEVFGEVSYGFSK